MQTFNCHLISEVLSVEPPSIQLIAVSPYEDNRAERPAQFPGQDKVTVQTKHGPGLNLSSL
jgi:hypothetical protein